MKNIKILLSLVLSLSIYNLSAQTIEREVLGTTGSTIKNTDCVISYTVGDLVITTGQADTSIVTQGFHQGLFIFNTSIPKVNNDLNIQIYPNPANAFLNIEFLQNTLGYSLEVFDISGRSVLNKKITVYESLFSIETNALSCGMYVLRLTAKDKSFTYSERFSVVR